MVVPNSPKKFAERIEIVDALRGSALLGLFLLHTIEHFDFARYPQNPPPWLHAIDLQVNEAVRFVFSHKAYAIFAMMFGLSFFMIIDRAARRGVDFRGRFLWRLGVLAAIGYVFGLIYCGEILTMLAVLGLPLVFFYRVPTRALAWLSALLLLQLPFLWQLGAMTFGSGYTPAPSNVGGYYRTMNEAFATQGFADVLQINAWLSVKARWGWSIDNGRYLQMFGLFIWGLLIGRSRIFEDPLRYARVARRVFIIGLVAFAVLYTAQLNATSWSLSTPMLRVVRRLLVSYVSLAQMLVWVSGFVLLYHYTPVRKALRLLIPYGRTSLTCYVTQSVIGVVLFYHFGFGLFRHCGHLYSILYGVGFFVVQCAAAHLWLKRYQYGPLEWFWRCATMLSFATPLRRRVPTDATPAAEPVRSCA